MKTDGEFVKAKVARVRSLLPRFGFDAIVVAKNENTRYLTGYQRYWCSTYLPFVHCVVVGRDVGPVLVVPTHIKKFAESLGVGEVRVFPQTLPDQLRMLAGLLAELGLAKARVGVEADFMYAAFHRGLQEGLPGASLGDCQPLMDAAIAVKLPEEIERIREACRIVDAGMEAMMESVRPGMTEKQLAAVAMQMFTEGAEFVNHICCRTGENADHLNPVNTDRVIRVGDPVQIDLGCIYDGYVADINRTLYVGGPNQKQAEVIECVSTLTREAIAAMRPGVKASDVFLGIRDLVGDLGFANEFNMPFIGHSIGLSLHENPYIEPSNHDPLEEGMVIAMEPGLYIEGVATCRQEDIAVVRRDGPEVLTHAKSDLALNNIS